MTNTDYLPGDRVRYVTKGGSANLHGLTGTILPPDPHEPSRDVVVAFDNDPDGIKYRMWWPDSDLIEREPIMEGCHVRWDTENHTNYIGKVVDIEHWCAQPVIAVLENGGRVTIEHIVRVAEPKRRAAGFYFDVMPDGTSRMCVEAATFTMSSAPDTLKQAQRLAEVLDRKHFGGNLKVPTHLTDVLNVIDHMTAHMVRSDLAESDHQDLNDLAKFLLHEIPGVTQNEKGAAGEAIRIITEQRAAIQTAARRIKPINDENRAWLAKHAPEKLKPVFKRGDLVTWGAGAWLGRIVGPAPTVQAPWEIIITASVGHTNYKELGTFVTPLLESLQHVETK